MQHWAVNKAYLFLKKYMGRLGPLAPWHSAPARTRVRRNGWVTCSKYAQTGEDSVHLALGISSDTFSQRKSETKTFSFVLSGKVPNSALFFWNFGNFSKFSYLYSYLSLASTLVIQNRKYSLSLSNLDTRALFRIL